MIVTDRKLLMGIKVLALIGAGIAVYSLAHKSGFASGSFCTIGTTFNCDIVNKGPYSELYGIPVALIGILGYGFLAMTAFLKLRSPADKTLTKLLGLGTIGGLGFSLYLTSIEAFVLQTWCLLCLTSQAIILTILVLTIIYAIRERRSGSAV